jgi:hypothetical protein
MSWTTSRLTVIGPGTEVARFQKSNWDGHLRAQHCDLLENSPKRFACQYQTGCSPLEPLRRLSRRWPRLILLLHYEAESDRSMGLAKARAGQLEHWETHY